MHVTHQLEKIAALVLERGQPLIFKRLLRASIVLGKHDTNKELAEGIDRVRDEDFEPDDDAVEDDLLEEDEAEDKEAYFPMGALPVKERRRGPHPKDVGVARPDWWNSY